MLDAPSHYGKACCETLGKAAADASRASVCEEADAAAATSENIQALLSAWSRDGVRIIERSHCQPSRCPRNAGTLLGDIEKPSRVCGHCQGQASWW